MSEEMRTTESPTPTQQQKLPQNQLGVPIAIVIAGLLVAIAIIFSGNQGGENNTQIVDKQDPVKETPEIVVAPLNEDDHILGNPNAKILIVEYSDFECPFCKNFHDTMNQIMSEFGQDGNVAWVYRHFPIKQLHPNAEKIAEASECVASIGGNEAFWKFSNFIFNERGTNEPTDMLQLPNYAEQSGVSKSAYTDCLDSGRFADKIQNDIRAAIDAGAQGTPYSVLIAGGQQGVINGAQQFGTVKQMIENVLTQLDGA